MSKSSHSIFCLVLLAALLLCRSLANNNVEFITNPSPGTSNGSIVYITADKGQQDVTVQCSITVNGGQAATTWIDNSNNQVISFLLNGGPSFTLGYEFLSASLAGNANVTISNFTTDLDRFMLACGHSSTDEQFLFVFGIPIISLLEPSPVYSVVEFGDFFLDLTNTNKTSFPPFLDQSSWTLDGVKISNTSLITITDYTIKITNLSRSYTGRVFNLSVANTAGRESKEFTLNINYQPEVERGDVKLYASVGDSVNITGTLRIDGNPQPTVTWLGPDDNEIVIGGRHTQPGNDSRILAISNLESSDFGVYTLVVSNGIGNDKRLDISLIRLVQPSQPRNLSYTALNTSGIALEWNVPYSAGVPPFINYIITLESGNVVIMTYITDDTNIVLESLSLGTDYVVYVTAASVFFTNGGETSDVLSFTTQTAGLSLEEVVGMSKDGYINVQWALESAGGHNIDQIMVMISCNTVTETTGKEISYSCNQNCFNSNAINGSRLIGPAYAGFKYDCSVTVRSGTTFSKVISSEFDTITGIPSKPAVIIDGTANTIQLMTSFTGTTSLQNFKFNVTIHRDGSSTSVFQMTYTGSDEHEIRIDDLQLTVAGEYIVTVTSINIYGASEETQSTFSVNEQTNTPSTITNMTASNELNIAFVAGASGGALGLIVLIVLGIIAVIGFAIHRRTKYNSTTFVANGKMPPSKMKFERARIPSVGSTVLY